MYCSSCGVAVAQNLTYCNNCGAKLTGGKTDTNLKTTELQFDSMIMVVMAALFILGLPAIAILVGVMKAILHFDFGPLVAFAFLSFLLLIALEGILMFRLFRRKRAADDSAKSIGPKNITKELEAQSHAFAEPVSSVIDHTPRTLDPVRVSSSTAREGSV